MTVGSTVIGVVVGVAMVAAAALIVYGVRGRGPKQPPRRTPQRQPRRGDDNPFQDVVERGRNR